MINDIFIYYINLEKDKQRNNYILNHFKELGINKFNRVDGVYGESVKNKPEEISWSEAGCTASHLKAIQMFIDSDEDFAVICEDDVDLSNISRIGFSFKDLQITNSHPFCMQLAVLSRIDMEINFNMHNRSFWDFGTTAYILNKTYAKYLINTYKNNDEIVWKNFMSRVVEDPRGGLINTRPVADELIYSLCDVLVYPVVSFVDFESTINNNDEQSLQIKYSINKFNDRWK